MTPEDTALELGNDKHRLERELRRSVYFLRRDVRGLFKRARYSFRAKRIISECGTYALEWRKRQNPDQPENYDNQQTSRGIVLLLELGERPASAV